MLDAVGDVGRDTHLCLHSHVGRCRQSCKVVEQFAALALVVGCVGIVVHHVESHHRSPQFLVAHEHRQVYEPVGILGVFDRNQHLLLVLAVLVRGKFLVSERDLLRCRLGDNGRYDAGEQDHDDHAVEDGVVYHRRAVGIGEPYAHHHHRYGSGGMCRREAEHHVARRYGQLRYKGRHVCGHRLAQRTRHRDAEHHPDGQPSGKE